MAGKPRSRYRETVVYFDNDSFEERKYGSGSWYQQSHSYFQLDAARRGEYTNDVVGNRQGDNPFRRETVQNDFITYNGEIVTHYPGDEPDGSDTQYRRKRVNGTTELTQAPYELQESDVEFVTRAFADTNPSKADFDAPIFLAELRDVPSLLRNAAQKLSKFGANEYLKYEYGWKPLVSDMRKMMRSMLYLERRIDNLRRLRNNHTIRRHYRPPNRFDGHVTPISRWESSLNDQRFPIIGTQRVDTERWCICTWIADDFDKGVLPATDHELMGLARRAILGGTIDGSTLWELMPWSWLIDWNTNVSEFLQSQRNIVGASPGPSCLMKHTRIRTQGSLTVDADWIDDFYSQSMTSSQASSSHDIKERIIGIEPAAVVTTELNLLGGDFRKQSILGALGIQRLRRLPF